MNTLLREEILHENLNPLDEPVALVKYHWIVCNRIIKFSSRGALGDVIGTSKIVFNTLNGRNANGAPTAIFEVAERSSFTYEYH